MPTGVNSVFAGDMDGDGDIDVVSGTTNIIWHENLGGYGKGTSFTKLKGHRLHFLKTNFLSKIRNYALERNDNYGTKSRIHL